MCSSSSGMVNEISKDKRGAIYAVVFGGRRFHLVFSNKGSFRGGHYHDFDSNHFILHGSLLCKQLDIENPHDEKETVVKAGDVVTVRSGFAHLFKSLEDSIFFESIQENYQAKPYPPYRKMVEEYLSD